VSEDGDRSERIREKRAFKCATIDRKMKREIVGAGMCVIFVILIFVFKLRINWMYTAFIGLSAIVCVVTYFKDSRELEKAKVRLEKIEKKIRRNQEKALAISQYEAQEQRFKASEAIETTPNVFAGNIPNVFAGHSKSASVGSGKNVFADSIKNGFEDNSQSGFIQEAPEPPIAKRKLFQLSGTYKFALIVAPILMIVIIGRLNMLYAVIIAVVMDASIFLRIVVQRMITNSIDSSAEKKYGTKTKFTEEEDI
jgi:hypothetical protein